MGKPRMTPPEGQRCECPRHEEETDFYPEKNPEKLARVYYEKGREELMPPKKFCYEWWCEACRVDCNTLWDSGGWPQGEDGKFMEAVHCPVVPGLD